MEKETKTAKPLFTIYSYSEDEYDAGVEINIDTSHEVATLTTAIAELILESDTFAEIWQMASIAADKLRAEVKNEKDKVFN